MTREKITERINNRISNEVQREYFELIFTELIRKFGEPEHFGSVCFLFSNGKYKFGFGEYYNGDGWCFLDYCEAGEYILTWNCSIKNCSSLENFLEKLKALNFDDEKNILSDARQISIEPDPAKTGWCKG